MKVKIDHSEEGPQPVLDARPELTVGALVHACHQTSIKDAVGDLRLEDLDDASLDQIFTYCAEQRCAAAKATCPGCRRRMALKGLESLDAYAAAHKEIVIGDGGVRVVGRGTEVSHAASLEKLAFDWAGESYWYWARRNLRKLRHGVRRSHIRGKAFAGDGETPSVILVAPQLADNIGMVARAMGNFGLDELRLVQPRDGWPNDRARFAASGANYIIDDAIAFANRDEAIQDLNWVAATTARQRDLRKPVLTPEQAAREMHARIKSGQRCGILFGCESSGLDNDDMAVADAAVMIPVNPRFASLNLAQAALLIGYEWLKAGEGATLGRVTTYEEPLQPGVHLGHDQPAEKAALTGLFQHLEAELDARGFFGPSHKRPTVVRNVRTMLTRMGLTDQEVRTLRGIVATLSQRPPEGRN